VERLIEIPDQNSQVGWIIDDGDVHSFYSKLLDKYGNDLKPEDLATLEALVEKGKPKKPAKPDIDDDIPF